MSELLPTATQTLLDLFRGSLKDVRFPDADAKRLETVVDAVKRANATLALAEAELLAARTALAQETERTLAYVRIYAADRPELRAALESGAAKPVKRGRPRSNDPQNNDPQNNGKKGERESGTTLEAEAAAE